MTGTINSDDAGTAEPRRPAVLGTDGDVTVDERTYRHEDTDHCAADAAGRAIVGLTADDGSVLLLVDREEEFALLPNDTVGDDETWRSVARETAREAVEGPVTVEAPIQVRRIEHYTTDQPDAGEATPHNVSYHVLYEASLDGRSAEELEPATDRDDDWEVGWYREAPFTIETDEQGDVVDDLRRILP